MTHRLVYILVSTIIVLCSAPISAKNALEKSEMEKLVRLFIQSQDALQTHDDIVSLSKVLHDDFEYNHAHYAIRLSKKTWQDTLLEQVNTRQTRDTYTQINHISYAYNAAFVQQSSKWQQRVNNQWYQRQSNTISTLFEFKEGKISAIREYW